MADERDMKILEAAMVLRSASYDGWEMFVVAIREFAAAATTDMLRVPPEGLAKQQGVALGLNQLALILRDAVKTYEARRHG